MDTLADLKQLAIENKAAVTALNTALDGYRLAVDAIKKQLADLLAGNELTPAVQAEVTAIASAMRETTAAVEATYAENFPAEPPPVEPPVDGEV